MAERWFEVVSGVVPPVVPFINFDASKINRETGLS